MAKKVKRDTWKTKTWYNVVTPEIFGNTDIGLTPANGSENVVGRIIETPLKDITGDIRQYYTKLRFRVNEVVGDTAKTGFIGHTLTRDYVQSIVRRLTTRIDDISDVVTKDKAKIRVKTLHFTYKRINSSKKAEIRKKVKEIIKDIASKHTLNQFVHELILGKTASDLFNGAKKIYPIRRSEIRKSEVLELAS